jgi:hypothetical protein
VLTLSDFDRLVKAMFRRLVALVPAFGQKKSAFKPMKLRFPNALARRGTGSKAFSISSSPTLVSPAMW